MLPARGDAPYDVPNPRAYQPAPPGSGLYLGHLIISPWVSVSEAYDDNVFAVGNGFCGRKRRLDTNNDGLFDTLRCAETLQPESSSLNTARAQVALKLPYSHSYTSISWAGQYRDYNGFVTPVKTSQLVDFENRLNFSDGSFLLFKDEYVRGFQELWRVQSLGFRDDRELESPGSFTFTAARMTRNHPEVQYDVTVAGAWGLTGKLERSSVRFGAAEFSSTNSSSAVGGETDQRGGVFDFYDYVRDGAELRAYRAFTAVRVYAAATVGRTRQDRSEFNTSQQNACRSLRDSVPDQDLDGSLDRCEREPDAELIREGGFDLGITGRLFPSTNADVKVGYLTWNFREASSRPFRGVSAAARVDHTFTRRTRASLGLQRTPVQASGQVSGYYLRTEVNAGVEQGLTNFLYAKVGLNLRRYDFSGSAATNEFTFTDYSGDFQLRYRPGQADRAGPLMLTLGYAPVLRRSQQKQFEYDSKRVTLSLLYGWF